MLEHEWLVLAAEDDSVAVPVSQQVVFDFKVSR